MPKEKRTEQRLPGQNEMQLFCDTAEIGSFEPFTSRIDDKIESGLGLLCEADECGGLGTKATVINFDAARALAESEKAQSRLQLAILSLRDTVMERKLRAAS